MNDIFSRRVFLSGLLCGVAGTALAEAPAVSLRPQIRPEGGARPVASGAQKLIRAAKLGGQVGCSVSDAKTGLILEGHDARVGLPPASVTKSITALYALNALGSGYRFKTRLIATGPIENGVIKGDLVLAGGGDPSLDTDALADMARKLKLAGVREVTGDFHVYGGALPFERVVDKDQPDHVAYNPSVSGLNLNYNRVHFQWTRNGKSYKVLMDARSKKYRPAVQVARMLVMDRSGPVYTYRDGGSFDSWTVARKFLGKAGSRWLPVRKPEAYTGEVFASFARAHGIVLTPAKVMQETPSGTVLVARQSAELRDILQGMLKYSNNLTAELVGLMATKVRKGHVGSIHSSAQEMSLWARAEMGMGGAELVDHSGLGGASRVSAEAMARALTLAHKEGALKPILKKITLRDSKGRANRGHPVKVFAKTGTLYFVSSLAGYITAPDGTELAFAIFAADTKRRDAFGKKQADRPPGSASYNTRAKRLQQKLIERWGTVYGS